MLFGVGPVDKLVWDIPDGGFLQLASYDVEDAAAVAMNIMRSASVPLYVNARGLPVDQNVIDSIVGDMVLLEENNVDKVMDVVQHSLENLLVDMIVIDDISSLISNREAESGDEFDTLDRLSRRMYTVRRLALDRDVPVIWLNKTVVDPNTGLKVYGRKMIWKKMKATIHVEPRRPINKSWQKIGRELGLRFIFSPPQFALRRTFCGLIGNEINEAFWLFKEALRYGVIVEEVPDGKRNAVWIFAGKTYPNRWKLIDTIEKHGAIYDKLIQRMLVAEDEKRFYS